VVCHTRFPSERSASSYACLVLPLRRHRRPRAAAADGMLIVACVRRGADGSYLVDPASSHMLVSKIKPCMSKYKLLCIVKLRMAH
jgi:hypothetical protein